MLSLTVQVCNHPRLVLTAEHPDYDSLLESHLRGAPANLLDIGKLKSTAFRKKIYYLQP
jgi:hypothetical protein